MSNIQDIFHKFYTQYKENYRVPRHQSKVASDILRCRTAALGGNVSECSNCGHKIIRYNSCRNRHCPMCQGVKRAVWVDQRSKDILNAPYFHVVFTLPQQLHPLVYQNQKLLYTLMYKSVAETLFKLTGDPKYLGAQIGFFSLLHTWGENLHYHPHIHTIVLAGGLTKLNKWRASSKKFFIPVRVLSKVFCGKFLFYLKEYYQQGSLKFYDDAQQFCKPPDFQRLLNACYDLNWYSYVRETFSGPLAVMKYLGRYTHRIAIANSRILAITKDSVTFSVKESKTVTLKGVEFIRRFLRHTLPKRFVKIRHYGLLANRNKKTKLALCRKLTKSPLYSPKYGGLDTITILSLLLGKDVTLCPACHKGKMNPIRSLCKAVP